MRVTPVHIPKLQRPDRFAVPCRALVPRLPLQVALRAWIAGRTFWTIRKARSWQNRFPGGIQAGVRNCWAAKAHAMRDASGPCPSLKGLPGAPPLHA